MPMYRPSELREFLDSLRTGPKKHLSQNFLIDGNILRKIVTSAGVQPGDRVLEIGPGPGALTECLLDAGAHVVAVEKDPILANALSRFSVENNKLEVYTEDIMDFSFENHLQYPTKVIANLPYHLTSPILGRLAPRHDLFTSIHVMVQEEVARRMVGEPNTPDYSSLTLFLRLYGIPTYSFGVGRNCFYPVPKVDSAVVCLTLRPTPKDVIPELFLKLVHMAFGQRRKMIRGTLKDEYGSTKVEEALTSLNLSPLARPEQLSFEQWVEFYRVLLKGQGT